MPVSIGIPVKFSSGLWLTASYSVLFLYLINFPGKKRKPGSHDPGFSLYTKDMYAYCTIGISATSYTFLSSFSFVSLNAFSVSSISSSVWAAVGIRR